MNVFNRESVVISVFNNLVQDCFFYSLVFDPVQKTLLADQGEIRVGSKYQAEIPDKLVEGELSKIGKHWEIYEHNDAVCYFS